MAADYILRTYGDVSAREDVVLNAVEILTARETQVFNLLPKSTAINTIHNYLTDTLRTVGSAAVGEAEDYTMSANTTPSRVTNIVEIVAIPFSVSRTQQQIAHYHGVDELTRQTQKALMDWANAAEYDLVRGTLASGISGTAPAMSGIIEAASKSTNHTSHSSGTVFNASIIDGLMQNQYTNSSGQVVATDLLLGAWLRTKMDQSIQKSNVVVNGPMTEIVKTVSTYTNAFGTLNIRTHRYLFISGTDSTARLLAIRPEKLAVAFLQNGGKPIVDTGLARSGDYDKRVVVGKFTLEVRNKDSVFFADGFHLTS